MSDVRGYTRTTARNVVLSDNKRLVHLAFRDVTEGAWWLRGKIMVPCQASRGFVPAKKQRHCRYATYTRRSVTCVFCLVTCVFCLVTCVFCLVH